MIPIPQIKHPTRCNNQS